MNPSDGRNRARPAAIALAGLLTLGTPWLASSPVAAQEAAAAVQDVTLQDVTLTFGGTRVIVPVLTVSGTRLSKDDLRAILQDTGQATGAEPWSARLTRLEAGSLVAPELRVEQADGSTLQSVTYRDVTAKGVRGGQVAELEISGATLSVTGASSKPAGTGTYGKIRLEALDLGALARLYAESGSGQPSLQRLCETFSIESIQFADDDTTVRLGAIRGGEIAARPVPTGWGNALKALSDLDPADPAQRAELGGLAADAIEGVSVGSVVMSDLSIKTMKDEPGDLGIGRIAYASSPEQSVLLSDITFAAAGSHAQLGSLKLSGFSFAPTVEALRRIASGTETRPDDLRRLTPILGTLSLAGLNLDLPREAAKKAAVSPGKNGPTAGKRADTPGDPLAAGADNPPLHLGVRVAAMTFGPPKDGVPAAGRLSLGGLTLPAALMTDVPVLGSLSLFGYRDLDLDVIADTAWDAAAKELALREISLSGKDMGSLSLSATLGGIGPEIFDSDAAVSGFAMLSATAKALDVKVKNGGLFERYIDTTAKSLSLKPEELRQEYATASLIGIPVILGNSTAAKSIGSALGRFVNKPDTLAIVARAKNGRGLGFLDFSTAATPAALLDKLDVDAKAD